MSRLDDERRESPRVPCAHVQTVKEGVEEEGNVEEVGDQMRDDGITIDEYNVLYLNGSRLPVLVTNEQVLTAL